MPENAQNVALFYEICGRWERWPLFIIVDLPIKNRDFP